MSLMYTAETRNALLEEYYNLLEEERNLDYEISLQGDDPDPEMEIKVQDMRDKLEELREQYRVKTPILPLSRCPHTGRLLYHSFDPYDLDGLWWNYESSIRPADRAPSRFLSLTGAMKLGKVGKLPHIVKPGPGTPYVIPELLGQDGVKAVLSQIQIGTHSGYVIAYFAEDKTKGFTVDTWGANHRAYVDHKDTFRYDEFMDDDIISYDFYLEPWLSQEKLHWVAPEDLGFNLNMGVAGCPYLNLEGPQKNQIIVNGKVHLDEVGMDIYEEDD